MSSVLFTNVQIFEGTKSKLAPGEVLIQGNRIKSVAAGHGKIPIEGVDEVIDGGGATLMPGLVNAHCHFTYNDATSLDDITALPVEEHMLVTMRNAKTYLDHGFTAVIGMASAKPRLEIVARDAVNRGHYPGPRILACTLNTRSPARSAMPPGSTDTCLQSALFATGGGFSPIRARIDPGRR